MKKQFMVEFELPEVFNMNTKGREGYILKQ